MAQFLRTQIVGRPLLMLIVGAMAIAAFTTDAMAQAASDRDVSAIPVKAATSTPAVGEEVIDETGVVTNAAYFRENRICNIKGCRVFIFDARSGALVNNDGQWTSAYGRTGRGEQVIRVKDYTSDENPKPAPSDAALDSAPKIRSVKRF